MPNEYDRIIKENIEAVILPLSDKLFGIRPEAMEELSRRSKGMIRLTTMQRCEENNTVRR